MSTYIPGVTDYIPQIQPFQPDLNFYANVMQTKQTKYDAAKKQISNFYGSLLYAPMTKDSNIKRRDEFFKVIDEDIKKISGMDLSLQQNVDQAMNIFSGFYDDKNMVNDMVWTKGYNNAVQMHQSLKNCFDPKKCGGAMAWDEGMQELQYKRDEFRNMSDEQALNTPAPTYTGYYDWKKDAMKAAADMGYNVTQDSFSKNGDYIITNKNGDLIKGGLYTIFKEAYGSDPRIEKNYNTMAYVKRNNAARSNASLYGSVDAAERQYIGDIINQGAKTITSQLAKTNKDYNNTAARIADLEKKQLNKGLSNDEKKILADAKNQKNALQESQDYLQKNLNAIIANAESGDIETLRRRADASTAQVMLEGDLNQMASAMARKGEEQTIKVNPMAEIKRRHEADIALAGFKHNLDMIELKQKHYNDMDLEKLKSMLDMGLLQAKEGLKAGEAGGQSLDQGYEVKEGEAGSNVQLDLEADKAAGYKYTKENVAGSMADAHGQSLNFLWNTFVAAKGAAQSGNPSVGAIDWLEKNVGKNWRDISNMADFGKQFEGKSVNQSYHQTLNLLKNGKTSDIGWGENLISKHRDLIDSINIKTTAANGELNTALNANLKIANTMKSTAATNPLYKYVDDLFVKGAYDPEAKRTDPNKPSGFLKVYDDHPPKSFAINYLNDHPYDSAGDVKDAWNTLRNDYLDRYNREAKTVGTGIALKGEGMVSANTYVQRAVDSADKTAGTTNQDVKGTLGQILNSQNFEIGIGGNSKATLKNASAEDQAALTGVANQFLADISKPWTRKDKNRPIYGVEATPIGAEDLTKGALHIKLDTDYIKKNTGKGKMFSEEMAPEIINNGITLFYDKNAVKTPLVEKADYSDLQKALKYGTNLNIESFADTAGDIKMSYNDLNNQVTFSIDYFDYDAAGNKNYRSISKTASLATADDEYNNIKAQLAKKEQLNNQQLDQIRKINKLKEQSQ